MRVRSFITNLLLLLGSLVVILLVLELAVRITAGNAGNNEVQKPAVPKHIVTGNAVLYALNPAHHQVSSQGLRDDVVPLPRAEGRRRILVLGDSIAYGSSVTREQTFPNRLETLLTDKYGPVDVINAGVSGYTAYNELQYYLESGRKFGADIVVVAFCMNDVVNPRLHWGYTDDVIEHIPAAAIPNPDYDRHHVLPKLEGLRKAQAGESGQHGSRLYELLAPRLRQLRGNSAPAAAQARDVPVYLTGDDDISIEVLLDGHSPEWNWLRGIYDQLHAAVEADGAQLVIGIFPLAYQLDPDYPYFPQALFEDYCRQRSIHCLDFLPPFRKHPQRKLFRLDRDPQIYDIWHLTRFGHDYTARVLMEFLEVQGLLR